MDLKNPYLMLQSLRLGCHRIFPPVTLSAIARSALRDADHYLIADQSSKLKLYLRKTLHFLV